MNPGVVGNWSPGIGDPTWVGWLTVVLYVAAAAAVWRVLRRENRFLAPLRSDERWVWRTLLAMLLALGLNKQLDLQSALTETGRIMAERQGWYPERQRVQLAFVVAMGIAGVGLLALLLTLAWGAPGATLWGVAGAVGLAVFVLVRAASVHRVDQWLGETLAGLRFNGVLEMGALLVIIVSTWRRRRVA